MYVKTLGDFYTTTADKLYRGQINFKILSLQELDQIIADGIVTYKALYPKKDNKIFKGLAIVALCIVAVAAISAVMAGTPAAAGGAVSATTGASTATATAITTGTVPATSLGSQVIAGVKSAGAYISAKVKQEFKSTVESVPDRLEETGKKLVNEKITDEAMEAFAYELDQRDQKMDDPKAIAALRERLKREQESYANYLRRQATEMREAEGVQKKPVDILKWAALLSPFAIAFLNK